MSEAKPQVIPQASTDAPAPAGDPQSVEMEHELSPRGMRWLVSVTLLLLFAALASGTWFVHRDALRSRNRVVCIGDSLTVCGGWGGRYTDHLADLLPDAEFVNKGVNGDTLAGGRRRFLSDVLVLDPKVVVIELGANDFHQRERSIEELRADLEFMLLACKDRGIETVVAGVFGEHLAPDGQAGGKRYKEGDPGFGDAILRMERELSAKYGASHVENIQYDLNQPYHWSDGRHPNAAGNLLVAQRLKPAIEAALARHAAQDPAP
ncbi:MAG: GDSL-type esterase/lipase family protein [Planctomycetota bacterium]|nr:GDSL-type esterase/lipase family protein [Planctomycetota bacterium]